MSDPTYEWHINVRTLNTYGDKVVKKVPATILAATRAEVTTKVRTAFDATYDDFRRFWSHDWTLQEVREVHAPTSAPSPSDDE